MSMDLIKPSILIATLGSEPQVVTATWDLLARKGEQIRQVQVVHTSPKPGRVSEAVEALRGLARETAECGPVRVSLHPLAIGRRLVEDVETPEAAMACFQALYDLVRRAKRQDFRVHLSIAGGRKNMAVFGMVAAQLLFDEDDRLWHLISEGEFLASKRLHPQDGDVVRLLEVPVLLRGYISPALTVLRDVKDAGEAIEQIRRLGLEEKLEQIRSFLLGSLTPGEMRVVELLAREGLNDRELARRLNLSARTVEQHLRSAYAKAGDHWELDGVNRAVLIRLVSLYFNLTVQENRGNPA